MPHRPDLLQPPATFETRPRFLRADGAPSIPGWTIRKQLPAHALAERYTAVSDSTNSPALIYRITRPVRRGSIEQLNRLTSLRHTHLQEIRGVEFAADDSLCCLAEYPGSHSGLLSLARLLSHKSTGALSEREVWHTASHLLAALESAHRSSVTLGPLRADDVLVDPRGRVLVELPGIGPILATSEEFSHVAVRADLRAAASLIHELLTGVPCITERRPAAGAYGRASRAWDRWLAEALDPHAGFDHAHEALGRLP